MPNSGEETKLAQLFIALVSTSWFKIVVAPIVGVWLAFMVHWLTKRRQGQNLRLRLAVLGWEDGALVGVELWGAAFIVNFLMLVERLPDATLQQWVTFLLILSGLLVVLLVVVTLILNQDDQTPSYEGNRAVLLVLPVLTALLLMRATWATFGDS
jgi:hypothetical protein